MRTRPLFLLGVSLALTSACVPAEEDPGPVVIIDEPEPEPEPECTSNQQCEGATPVCGADTQVCEAPPAGGLIGWGDGTFASIDARVVFQTTLSVQLTDIDFNPQVPEQLWLTQRPFESLAPCTSAQPTPDGCGALAGLVTIVFNPGAPEQRFEEKRDGNAWHFMRRPTALAFGDDATFATIGEARTGNYTDQPQSFMGPSLWSSDLSIFAQDPGLDAQGMPLNGSHLDMLHATPWGMGIAHESGNIYWVFNGDVGALDRYDFKADHGPGYHDHSDGEVQRHSVGAFKRQPGIPSHMEYIDGKIYVADTGNGRVAVVDPSTSMRSGDLNPVYEPLAMSETRSGSTITDLTTALTAPSGMAYDEAAKVLYVSDNATGTIHAFDLEGNELRTLKTDLAAGDLGAITIGPDNKLYYSNLNDSTIWRIEPK